MLSLALLCLVAAQEPMSMILDVTDCDSVAVWRGDAFLACHSRPGGVEPQVLRVNLKTRRVVYATRLRGTLFTAAFRVRIDTMGFAYVVGLTRATDFATTSDAAQRKYGGGVSDAFFVKLNPSGRVVYATLLGGSGTDEGNAIELDGNGGVFIGGMTSSGDFANNAHPRTWADAFVAHLVPGKRDSLRVVAFGGSQEEKLTGLALDGKGGIFAVGYTKSADFPAVSPVQEHLRGVSDLFLTRLRVSDFSTTFSTYFGGAGDDSGWGIAVDAKGNPVVSGITDSNDLGTPLGGKDALLVKFEGPGYRTVRSTRFGGSKDDESGYDGDNIKIDRDGRIWLVGMTSSRDLPTKSAYKGGELDGFVAVFSPSLSVLYGTYHGSAERDLLEGIDLAANGAGVATGLTFANGRPQAMVVVLRPF